MRDGRAHRLGGDDVVGRDGLRHRCGRNASGSPQDLAGGYGAGGQSPATTVDTSRRVKDRVTGTPLFAGECGPGMTRAGTALRRTRLPNSADASRLRTRLPRFTPTAPTSDVRSHCIDASRDEVGKPFDPAQHARDPRPDGRGLVGCRLGSPIRTRSPNAPRHSGNRRGSRASPGCRCRHRHRRCRPGTPGRTAPARPTPWHPGHPSSAR